LQANVQVAQNNETVLGKNADLVVVQDITPAFTVTSEMWDVLNGQI